MDSLTDEELAVRLQAEEDERAAAIVAAKQEKLQHQQQQHQQPQHYQQANQTESRPHSKLSNSSGTMHSTTRTVRAPSTPIEQRPVPSRSNVPSRQRHHSSDSSEDRRQGKKQSVRLVFRFDCI